MRDNREDQGEGTNIHVNCDIQFAYIIRSKQAADERKEESHRWEQKIWYRGQCLERFMGHQTVA